MEREGFRRGPELDITTFALESDNEGDLLPIFDDICHAIDRVLWEGESVLVWDIGGGVAGLAAYSKYNTMYGPKSSTEHISDKDSVTVMKRHGFCLPEAMTVITRARLMRAKPKLLPSQRIIDTLHNDKYLRQLEMWEACRYDIYEYTVVNPDEPREKWIVERVEGNSEKKEDERAFLNMLDERFPDISGQAHRLSVVEEVEEEAQEAHRPSTIEEVAAEAHRLSTIYEE